MCVRVYETDLLLVLFLLRILIQDLVTLTDVCNGTGSSGKMETRKLGSPERGCIKNCGHPGQSSLGSDATLSYPQLLTVFQIRAFPDLSVPFCVPLRALSPLCPEPCPHWIPSASASSPTPDSLRAECVLCHPRIPST